LSEHFSSPIFTNCMHGRSLLVSIPHFYSSNHGVTSDTLSNTRAI
jgi:hypothetical protein